MGYNALERANARALACKTSDARCRYEGSNGQVSAARYQHSHEAINHLVHDEDVDLCAMTSSLCSTSRTCARVWASTSRASGSTLTHGTCSEFGDKGCVPAASALNRCMSHDPTKTLHRTRQVAPHTLHGTTPHDDVAHTGDNAPQAQVTATSMRCGVARSSSRRSKRLKTRLTGTHATAHHHATCGPQTRSSSAVAGSRLATHR